MESRRRSAPLVSDLIDTDGVTIARLFTAWRRGLPLKAVMIPLGNSQKTSDYSEIGASLRRRLRNGRDRRFGARLLRRQQFRNRVGQFRPVKRLL